MSYATVTVLVNGALEASEDVQDRDWDDYLNAKLSEIDAQHKLDGQPTEVYILWHEHEPDVECECAQYELDHSPAYSWFAMAPGA